MISLVSEIINHDDIDALVEWLKTYPRLTKGPLTKEFEAKWAEAVGSKYAVYVNSGSSANLLMAYAALRRKPNVKVVVPAVSWATSLAPFIQIGSRPILCDADRDTLCVDLNHLEYLFRTESPAAFLMVNVLGFLGDMDEIARLCKLYGVILLEDSCETVGSTYKGKQAGTFGYMSAFSFYFGHHISTIEGGMVCTNNKGWYHTLLMLRNHGWDRDLDEDSKRYFRNKNMIDEFKSMYTFYEPGFNLRSTDLQAFIGLRQIDKLKSIHATRHGNFNLYQELIHNDEWKPNPKYNEVVSNFAYPVIHSKSKEITKALQAAEVECRPLICGSLGNQPYYKEYVSRDRPYLPMANMCDTDGIYVPNHIDLSAGDIQTICDIINGVIN